MGTVGEQMLYEIGDPQNYILPDIVVDFTQVQVQKPYCIIFSIGPLPILSVCNGSGAECFQILEISAFSGYQHDFTPTHQFFFKFNLSGAETNNW